MNTPAQRKARKKAAEESAQSHIGESLAAQAQFLPVEDISPKAEAVTTVEVHLNEETTMGPPRGERGPIADEPQTSALGKLFYRAMAFDCFSGDEVPLVWTWSEMCRDIGAEPAVERINSMMTQLGVMSALLLTLTVDALLNPPSSTSENDVTVYGCLFASSTFFLAAGMLLSVTVMIQLNTIKWDTMHLTEALTKKGAQNVISVWSFQFFNIGVFLCIAGFNMAVWIVYDRVVFWVSIGCTAGPMIGSIYFGANVASAMMSTWKDSKRRQGVFANEE
eukprot:m.507415 g.507415  ORF g.507415 m.507415 type:complete len:278 (-) comp21880_c2_seq2:2033-2866(-)